MERTKENASNQKLATLTCGKMREDLHLLVSKEHLVEVEHVKAHRTKKMTRQMSQFEKVCHRRQ